MPSDVSVNLKGLEKQIANLKNFPMKNIAEKAHELQFDQIEAKKNNDGSRFKEYSEAYADKKGVGRNDVDLTSKASAVTNKSKPFATMLRSFGVLSVSPMSAVLGFRGVWDKQKAYYNVSGGKNRSKARPFVGLMTKSRKKLLSFAFKLISRGTY